MHTGQWHIVDGGNTLRLFSPWFPRGGDNAVFTYEEIAEIGNPTFTVKVVHKDLDDAGNGSIDTSSSFSAVSGTSFFAGEYTGLKELVRFQFDLASSASEGVKEMVLYRMLAPTWFNDAE